VSSCLITPFTDQEEDGYILSGRSAEIDDEGSPEQSIEHREESERVFIKKKEAEKGTKMSGI
jgi:hypothetical protein